VCVKNLNVKGEVTSAHTQNTNRGEEVQFHSFLTLAVDAVNCHIMAQTFILSLGKSSAVTIK
jgi:hypothetical protein